MKRALVLLAVVASTPLVAAQMYTAGPTAGAMPVVDLNPQPCSARGCSPASRPTPVGITSDKADVHAGATTRQGVAKLGTLKWHKSLAEAAKVAGSTGKPIFWLQILGQLQGFA